MLANTEKVEKNRVFGVGQIKRILNTDVSVLKELCKKACLRPKKDKMGSVYFSKDDVELLKKMKFLQEKNYNMEELDYIPKTFDEVNKKQDFKALLKEEKTQVAIPQNSMPQDVMGQFQNEVLKVALNTLEVNIVQKITDVLAEKMDGLDEVVVELIRAKTENETLRQRINELNKENFNLKNENASYQPIALGFYKKKDTQDFIL